jgi:ribosome biogenesis GTPase / thiamine phosphate phosphatase
VSIEDLGWNSYFAALWDEFKDLGWSPARVISQQRNLWRIAGNFGESWAAASGRLREVADTGGDWPAVGDWVATEPSDRGRAILQAVLPRRSQFVRGAAGKRLEQQVIAANVDTTFVVAGLDGDLNLRRLERYLAQCWDSGSHAVILLNKVDSCGAVAACLAEVGRIAAGVPVVPVSAHTGQGMDAFAAFLARGQTVVLIGSSGVGKSTLINHLLGEDVQSVQPTREKDGRGRHTTTARQLLTIPNGAMVIDTPGLRELQLWDATDGVSGTFADINELAAECRFRDCQHQREPGCAVRTAIETGALDPARLENRRKLEREQEFQRRKVDPEARKQQHDELKVPMRGVREMYRQRAKDRGDA